MNKELQKPVFAKVSSLTNCRDGYNVYVKVVSAEVEASQTSDSMVHDDRREGRIC